MVQDSGTLSHIDQIWGVIFKQGYQIKYKMSSQLRISDWQQILFSIASAMQYLGHTSIKNLSVFFSEIQCVAFKLPGCHLFLSAKSGKSILRTPHHYGSPNHL